MRPLYYVSLFLIFCTSLNHHLFGQGLLVTITPPTGYDTTTIGARDTFIVEVKNITNVPLNVQYALIGVDALLERNQDVIASGGLASLQLFFDPNQNLDYSPIFVAIPDKGLGPAACRIIAPAVFPLTDYRSTRNLWEEPLKQALKSIVSKGSPIGYTPARDQMYMNIDNQKVNGQGASQNTLECIYTGQLAVGYTDRTDAQNNYGFNTEHTFPQGTFNSNEPMKSDLFHLFPTTATSNSERANKPFGVVANPTWQAGGSKSDANHFEPRPQQKGPTARAMLYFLVRFQNYQNYVSATDQDLLEQWCLTYTPSQVERTRNDDIEQVQGNRNPFIDYPQLVERITSFISTSTGVANVQMEVFPDSLKITGTDVTSTFHRQVVVVNSGNRTYAVDRDFGALDVSNVDWSTSYTNDSLPPGHYGVLSFELNTTGQSNVADELTLTNSRQPANPQIVYISAEPGQDISLGRGEIESPGPYVYPNPSNSIFCLGNTQGQPRVTVLDLTGKQQKSFGYKGDARYDVTELPPGFYLIKLHYKNGQERAVPWVKR